jgi:hypothetical protein
MPVLPALLADCILIVHSLFILFVVLGQVLILLGWHRHWAWTRSFTLRLCHLAAIGVVVIQSCLGIACPLTALENSLRYAAGEAGYQLSFIGDCLQRLCFYTAPAWVFTAAYSLFGLVVLLTWCLYPPRWRTQAR